MIQKFLRYKDWFYKPMTDDSKKLQLILKLLKQDSFWIALNMNDTFGYGCADIEDLTFFELEKILPIYEKYGDDALTAFACVKRGEGCMPIKERQNANFSKALVEIKNILTTL